MFKSFKLKLHLTDFKVPVKLKLNPFTLLVHITSLLLVNVYQIFFYQCNL